MIASSQMTESEYAITMFQQEETQKTKLRTYSFSDDTGDAQISVYSVAPGIKAAFVTVDYSLNSGQRKESPVVDKDSLHGLAPEFNRGEAVFERNALEIVEMTYSVTSCSTCARVEK